MSQVSIIIPVFNESATVEELLQRVWAQELPGLKKELIVVESNSTDDSREKVQRFCSEKEQASPTSISVQLILQDRPKGKGNAIREGLKAATGDIILIQDSDLEYDTRDYPALLEPILQGKADLVLGSRHLGAGSWKIRKFEENPFKASLLNIGGILFHTLFNVLYNQTITDPTTMFKVFRRKCLEGIHLQANRFDFDFELLGKLLLKGYVPYEVPVNYVSRGFASGKKIRIFRDPFTWLVAILRYRFTPVGENRILLEHLAGVFQYFGLAVLLFLGSCLITGFLGGPFKSPDSIYYEEGSAAPWTRLGGWHPAGMSFLLFFGKKLGLGSFAVSQLAATTLCLLFFYVVRRTAGVRWAWVALLLFFFDPSSLMLRSTLWSEVPFLCCLTLLGALLSLRRFHWPTKVGVALGLFLVSAQLRLVGIFFLPALALGLGFVWSAGAWAFHWKKAAIATLVLLTGWMTVNRLTTGRAIHASNSHGVEECRAVVMSMNPLPYCTWDPSIPICTLDPERKYLNNPFQTSNEDFFFHYISPESPVWQFTRSHSDVEVCDLQSKIMKATLHHGMVSYMKMIAKRAWQQYGRWGWTERAKPDPSFTREDRVHGFDVLLEMSNRGQKVFQLFLIFCSFAFLGTRTFCPDQLFYWLGGIGHAVGVSIVNPYRVLRYMAIHKYLIFLCMIYWVYSFLASRQESPGVFRVGILPSWLKDRLSPKNESLGSESAAEG